MSRDVMQNAQKGKALAGGSDLRGSEINTIYQIGNDGDPAKAIATAFYMGLYVGYQKRSREARKRARQV